jgi:hypothetical protein
MKRDHFDAFSLPRIDLLDSPLFSPPQPIVLSNDEMTDSGYCSERPDTPRFNGSRQSSYTDSMVAGNVHDRYLRITLQAFGHSVDAHK